MNVTDFVSEFLNYSTLTSLFYFPNFFWILFFLLLIWGGKKSFAMIVAYDLENELVKTDNKAVAVAFAGYVAGLGLILESVLESATGTLLDELMDVAIWAIIGVLLLNLAGWINDKLILRKFNNRKELIEDKNIGTAAVIAGGYLASAIMIRAIIVGDSEGWFWDIGLSIFYFLIAQVAFYLFSILYEKIIGYDLHGEIEKDNIAAGVSFGMNLVAVGILLAAPLKTTYSIIVFVAWFIIGSSVLAFTRFVLDRLMVPSESLDREIYQDQNWGIAIFEGLLSILAAVLLVNIF